MEKCSVCGAEVNRLFNGVCARCMSARAIEYGMEQEAAEEGGLPDVMINEPGIDIIDVFRRSKQPYHGDQLIGPDGLINRHGIFQKRYSDEALKRKFGSHWKDAGQLATKWQSALEQSHILDGGRFDMIPMHELMENQSKYELCEGQNNVCVVCLKGTDTEFN